MPDTTAPRTAIVTGAGRGIGRGIAVALGSAGFNVVINYNANADAADQCAALVREAGGNALTVQASVAHAADRERLLSETVGAFNRVDLLVNNAGIAPPRRADMLDAGEESFDTVITTNLKGPYFLSQLVARHMIDQRENYPHDAQPAIINISSISAYTASVNRGDYCISKAGIAMMTRLFAARLAEHNINVYEIRPGIIATDMTGPVTEKYDKLIFEGDLLPLRRWGTPEDVGKAVLAVATGALPYSTGAIIDVDGGFHMHRL